ncbi:RPM1-interacting protein 4-like isoform X2 [Olea europaea var. sylvestris]|uniref:RIN4 pathogenic type III effector avirulence factor Avr cleavage site domain-containing protein n=1 Tax=Olea europaea subsp. europaea TaxID=158383 RepID=A0A8S0PRW0_OLEEU|nr:RPM1-interacting protein 4-like isoform X2 [Olea europaea var. sylvestris]CAA2956769.1 Hypothetical predicted protein [Olea europaea subsp. europaea]
MARSHVPKFGNWEGDNVPYTAYFENARKEKTGGVMINPNDPEQNPEAFNFGNRSRSGAASASIRISPDKSVAAGNFQQYVRQRNAASESGSDKSASDNSFLKPKHQRRRSERNKSLDVGSNSRSNPLSAGPNRMNHADDFSYKSASVPKFGEWDERDPRSGEGFTVIFNKVKEEKQIAAAKFSPVPLQTANDYPTSPNKKTTRSKKCCCLF